MVRFVNALALAAVLDIAFCAGRVAGSVLAGMEESLRRAAR